MGTFVKYVNCIAFLFELVVGEDEVFEEVSLLAAHVLHQVAGHETQVLLDLLY